MARGSDMSPESAKTRLRRIQPSLVMSSADNGIEKVRGSTPLISTIHESASGPRGSGAFLVFQDASEENMV